jgi:hypothetical protein
MKKYAFYLIINCLFIPIYGGPGNEPIKELIGKFMSADWPSVMVAKEKLENYGSAAIPEIMALMNDCKLNKLKSTGDLIYPGAEKFFGHGQIIDYDIDNTCVRAGWLLEELTFMDFGFSGIHLPANELAAFVKTTFPDYYGNAENQKRFNEMDEEAKREAMRSLSIEKAKSWWQISSKQWNRLSALEQALVSTDETCQVKALFYLRNGRTSCKGLTQKYYRSKMAKTVEKLSKAETSRVSENAKLIMLDSDFSWLSIKPVN